ncbi:chymotrypsin-like elastase family member 3B [Lepus europaeus]|uniref:chymotrypsin-like elastase family member 3B n=1 Tax=Lepus europaeus TaxID=9983 RepID=UPI002B482273|nr:chymotrypsin-like elastase family member 3B [Lepus europaeus]
MLRLLSTLLLVALASASGQPSFRPSIRVVNGTSAVPHSWPWQALLLIEQGDWLNIYCGGTLIKHNWVLTAAHCISNEKYWVALGEHDTTVSEGSEQLIPVEAIYVHPLYNNDDASQGYDIALLKLLYNAELTDEVKLACLPPAGYILPHGTECYITGWGNLNTNGPIPDQLQQGLLPAVDHPHCTQPDWWGSAVKEIHVCAGGGYSSACYGDSGGPLNCRGVNCKWEVHGVVSFGPEICNTEKKPTVFTRVSAYIDWIIGIIGSGLECSC